MAPGNENQLFEIALSQQGYFTSQQAIQAGYRENNHQYHIIHGRWVRELRGVYRLVHFPHQPESQYVLWSLWSCNKNNEPQGVYSHDTALSIYNISDIMPAKLHMTVPKKFRKNNIPKVLVLYHQDLHEKDYQTMGGFKVTKPLRTILDIIEEKKTEEHFIQQAINEFTQRGLITRKDTLRVIEQIPTAAKFFMAAK